MALTKRLRTQGMTLQITRAEIEFRRRRPDGEWCAYVPSMSELGFLYGADADAWVRSLVEREGFKARILYHYTLSGDRLTLNDTATSKSALLRRAKRLSGGELNVIDHTPAGPRAIMRLWKLEQIAAAKQYVKNLHAGISNRKIIGSVRN